MSTGAAASDNPRLIDVCRRLIAATEADAERARREHRDRLAALPLWIEQQTSLDDALDEATLAFVHMACAETQLGGSGDGGGGGGLVHLADECIASVYDEARCVSLHVNNGYTWCYSGDPKSDLLAGDDAMRAECIVALLESDKFLSAFCRRFYERTGIALVAKRTTKRSLSLYAALGALNPPARTLARSASP